MYEVVMALITTFLVGGFLFALWRRDRLLGALCKIADPMMRVGTARDHWIATYNVFLHSIARSRRAAILKQNVAQLPVDVQRIFEEYRTAQRVLTALTFAMIAFFILALIPQLFQRP